MSTTPSLSSSDIKVSPAPALISNNGKVAIVTGASRGIGQGIALRLAKEGAKVIVNYNSDVKSANAVVETIIKSGGIATAIKGDTSLSSDVDRLFEESKKLYGRIDIVVANAGVYLDKSIATTTNDELDRIINVNIRGVFFTLRAAANHIENNGRIIVIGSIAKVGTMAGLSIYGASKAAEQALVNTLAQELGSKGVTVNGVHPGPIDTDMFTSVAEGAKEAFKNLSPQKRVGTIFDVGDAVSLLASEAGRWISGQSISVAGGAPF